MTTKAEVLRLLRFRDALTRRDVELILDYTDQEVAAGIFTPNDNIGKGVLVRANDDVSNLPDDGVSTMDLRPEGGEPSQITYDDLGFYDTDGDTTRLTIPLVVPAIERVRVWGYVSLTGANGAQGDRGLDIRKNNGNFVGSPEIKNAATNGTGSQWRAMMSSLIMQQMISLNRSMSQTYCLTGGTQ